MARSVGVNTHAPAGEAESEDMGFIIRDYQAADWPAIGRVHDRARPDELRGSFDPRAFIPLAEDPEGAYAGVCDMFVAQKAMRSSDSRASTTPTSPGSMSIPRTIAVGSGGPS